MQPRSQALDHNFSSTFMILINLIDGNLVMRLIQCTDWSHSLAPFRGVCFAASPCGYCTFLGTKANTFIHSFIHYCVSGNVS